MSRHIDCPACLRPIRPDETACPFCGAEQRQICSSTALVFGVLLGLMTVSCGDKPGPGPSTESSTAPTSTAANTGTTDGSTSSGTLDPNVTTAYAGPTDSGHGGAPAAASAGAPGEAP